jgi:hypothetical protein
MIIALALASVLAFSSGSWAQDASAEAAEQAVVELTGAEDLQVLVARIAFYPDEVVAVTLPASTYPLDVVQAARFLDQREDKPDAQPSPDWDPSVLALLNYPVVVSMMNDDLDWTTQLGEAVLAQQGDVMDAIQQVRKSAYTAGHLQSSEKTVVVYEEDVVQIQPADPEVVYVPVYETAPPTTTTTVYYPTTVVYSEPYTPYYNEAAAFWTGAIVGGVTMGFLMDWDDDDIDIDINDGDWDNWHPGDTDINVDRGDINIGGDVNIGNDVKVGKGDSWRQMRTQRTANQQVSQLSRKTKTGAQPVASQQIKGQGKTSATTQAAGVGKKQTTSKTAQQKSGALGTVERGQDSLKASKQGSKSRETQAQNKAKKSGQAAAQPTKKKSTSAGTSAKKKSQRAGSNVFGGYGGGKQTQQFSNRGNSSQKKRLKR